MMKVLDYEAVNGDQDRDETVMVAHLIQKESQVNLGNNGRLYVGEDKKVIVTEVNTRGGESVDKTLA
jgi:hypothetical protein